MRESWHEYFLKLASTVAGRSTCIRRQVGAVAVDENNRVIGTGYNGAPSGLEHCTKETCYRTINNIPSGRALEICKAIHAEANIVLHCGKELQGATVYCTNKPCISCFKLLYGAGVKRIVWSLDYFDTCNDKLMNESGTIFKCEGYSIWER